MTPHAILFDWDNTLVDNWPTIHRATNATLAAMGHDTWSFEETLARVRQSMRDSFPRLFGDRWEEAREVFYATFQKTHLEELEVVGGAEDALEHLAATGIPLGVVSNKTGALLRAESTKLGWDRHFKILLGAGDAPMDKPDPAPIHMALDAIGVQPGLDVWYVGDAAIDVTCARAAGCSAVLISAGRVHPEEAIDPPPDRHVKTFQELVDLAASQQNTI
jgi:phosphoglycolate phosphatase